jgi:hypothetical protein
MSTSFSLDFPCRICYPRSAMSERVTELREGGARSFSDRGLGRPILDEGDSFDLFCQGYVTDSLRGRGGDSCGPDSESSHERMDRPADTRSGRT